MEKLIESLNILNKLKDFFESNKIPTLIYLVFMSIGVILILQFELAWAYYFLAITAPALLTKVSMQGIDFISPSIIGRLKRMTINRKLNNLKDYEKKLITQFIDEDDTIMTIDKNYRCESLIKRGVLIVHETIIDEDAAPEDKLKTDKVLVEMDRKAFIKVKNNQEIID